MRWLRILFHRRRAWVLRERGIRLNDVAAHLFHRAKKHQEKAASLDAQNEERAR